MTSGDGSLTGLSSGESVTVAAARGWASEAVGLLLLMDRLLKGVGPEQGVHAVKFLASCLDQAGAGQGFEGTARQRRCHPGEGGDGSRLDAGSGAPSGEPERAGGEIV